MPDATIEAVDAREILDNRLEPTLRVTVETTAGRARADVPCGRSRGSAEAVDLRDGGDRYRGRGVRTAVRNVTERIAPELVGRPVADQRAIDRALIDLDGTPDRSDLGGNATAGASLAVLKAGADARGVPLYRHVGGVDARALPVPLFDLIEGGELAGTDLAFQEHHVVPTGAESFAEAIRRCSEVYHELGAILEAEYGPAARAVGDEGGYAPPGLDDPRDAFDLELRAVEECGYGGEFTLAADAAATHFYDADAGAYRLAGEERDREELLAFHEELAASYPLVSLEDPVREDDPEGFAALTDRLDVQVVGDDLFASTPDRVRAGIGDAADALLLKVNQVGTVSEALTAASLAHRTGNAVQVSERSGQTADTWLADLAAGLNAGQIKTGVSRSERTEQYNRLLAIESDLGGAATYGPVAGPSLSDYA